MGMIREREEMDIIEIKKYMYGFMCREIDIEQKEGNSKQDIQISLATFIQNNWVVFCDRLPGIRFLVEMSLEYSVSIIVPYPPGVVKPHVELKQRDPVKTSPTGIKDCQLVCVVMEITNQKEPEAKQNNKIIAVIHLYLQGFCVFVRMCLCVCV